MPAYATGETVTVSGTAIDMDGSVDTTTGTPSAQQRSLVAFTLELAAVGDDVSFVGRRRVQ